jgi:hypothetical protein
VVRAVPAFELAISVCGRQRGSNLVRASIVCTLVWTSPQDMSTEQLGVEPSCLCDGASDMRVPETSPHSDRLRSH